MFGLCLQQFFADGFAVSKLIPLVCRERIIDKGSSFRGHTKTTVLQACRHIFAGNTPHGNFRIMDNTSTIHCQMGDVAFFDPINNQRTDTAFDNMCAHHPDNSFLLMNSQAKMPDKLFKILSDKNVGKRFKEIL